MKIGFLNYWKYKEPLKQKLKRWIFGEKNYIGPTIIEQRIGDVYFLFFSLLKKGMINYKSQIKLQEITKDLLSEFFEKHDNLFKFGINRKYLLKVYKKLGFFKNKEEKDIFMNNSGYRKKVQYI